MVSNLVSYVSNLHSTVETALGMTTVAVVERHEHRFYTPPIVNTFTLVDLLDELATEVAEKLRILK